MVAIITRRVPKYTQSLHRARPAQSLHCGKSTLCQVLTWDGNTPPHKKNFDNAF